MWYFSKAYLLFFHSLCKLVGDAGEGGGDARL